MSRLRFLALGVLLAAGGTLLTHAQSNPFLPVDDIRPGMVGVGRTVFQGDTLEDFTATIVGVLQNAMGPGRDLILARLEGGPLANTGVIAGMSGSPVYIDGRLIGAVSYAIGSFPKEPLAGITPIAEMTSAVDTNTGRTADRTLAVNWPAPASDVFAALGRLAERASAPLGPLPGDLRVVGPASLAGLAPGLHPIAAAMVLNGFDPSIASRLRSALGADLADAQSGGGAAGRMPAPVLRPGDPVGMSLVRGDLEMGATGTVTYVDGARVYAFGHPFLNLGSTSLPMTQAHVFTVLPSLESSIKIATLGPVVGSVSQDRATAVGGRLGAGPRELTVNLRLTSEGAPERRFQFFVARDPSLTPLFTYVAVLNALTAYERQTGVLSISATGSVSFGQDGQVRLDDLFSGEQALTSAATAIAAPIGLAMANEFRTVEPDTLDLELHTSEKQEGTTIERVWLDTTRPHFGETHTLQVQLQDYRGAKRIVTMPVTMPSHAEGPLTLLVSDAASLSSIEQRDLKPGKPTTWPDLLHELNTTRRNNRLYVRLISTSTGTVVGGDTLPALPSSVRSILDSDTTIARAPVARTIVGSWDQRLDLAVRGSREISITLSPR